MATSRRAALAIAATIAMSSMFFSGCSGPAQPSDDAAGPASATAPERSLPDPRGGFDYQLGGASGLPDGVTIVERDRTDAPAGKGYDICYVNGFQTQPAESETFAAEHPELLVHRDGKPLVDPDWPDEYLFDTSTPKNRALLTELVGAWIIGCHDAGYDAVEIDNLDSYTRSEGEISAADNILLATAYARVAHDAGVAIAQKNTADMAVTLKQAGYDFAVTESCVEFSECDAFTSVYDVVLDIEYTDTLGEASFSAACADPLRPGVVILRDHDLVPPGDPSYHYDACQN